MTVHIFGFLDYYLDINICVLQYIINTINTLYLLRLHAAEIIDLVYSLSPGLSVVATIPKCGGCQEVILDKYVLRVLERCWHARCLTCRDCGARLTDKCFARNGHVFCKDDFFK